MRSHANVFRRCVSCVDSRLRTFGSLDRVFASAVQLFMREILYVHLANACQGFFSAWNFLRLRVICTLRFSFGAYAPLVRATCALEHAMEKANKAAELNAGIKQTIERLANETDAATKSELFKSYLRTSTAFYTYSWHNQMLIWRQRPDASFVGGFHMWLKCGRYVRKAEKSIAYQRRCFSAINARAQTTARNQRASGSGWSTCSTNYLVICGQASARSM